MLDLMSTIIINERLLRSLITIQSLYVNVQPHRRNMSHIREYLRPADSPFSAHTRVYSSFAYKRAKRAYLAARRT